MACENGFGKQTNYKNKKGPYQGACQTLLDMCLVGLCFGAGEGKVVCCVVVCFVVLSVNKDTYKILMLALDVS